MLIHMANNDAESNPMHEEVRLMSLGWRKIAQLRLSDIAIVFVNNTWPTLAKSRDAFPSLQKLSSESVATPCSRYGLRRESTKYGASGSRSHRRA